MEGDKESLHEEMKRLLQQEPGRQMSTEKIASLVKHQTTNRKTGLKGPPKSIQIAMRASNRPDQFEVIVCLKEKK